ncbi:MAG TPA: lysophospholipase [Stellaceae bacterium]|nr:lysophospholipase [Stellaceae bacterium]
MRTRVFGARMNELRRHRWLLAGVACAVLAAALAACAPNGPDAPGQQVAAIAMVPPQLPPPTLQDAVFTTTDDKILPLRRWLPNSGAAPRAVILALHGFNDYSNAFDAPAKEWAKHGIATYAYDQRGFGGAPGRGFWPGSRTLTTDAVTAATLLRAKYLHTPLYLLGESMGGAVAILAATGATGIHPAAVDGVILSAPAVWTRESMQFLPRLALWAGVRLFPGWVLTGESLHILASDNIPMLIALSRDPMVIKGTRIDTIYGLVDLMDRTIEAAPRLTAPLLMMYGAHDAVIPADPVRTFVAALPPQDATRERFAYYRKGYHMLMRDLEGKAVADDVASWVLDRPAALPSRADAIDTERPWPPIAAGG